ncbi:MAG: hypothetical protein NTZ09_03875 [Candidatus Hydrogenedentes bacterium]|nr:hypothetical protein [Candidatus Hydrogenedentota bacterium]
MKPTPPGVHSTVELAVGLIGIWRDGPGEAPSIGFEACGVDSVSDQELADGAGAFF